MLQVYLYAPLDEVEPDAIQQLIKVAESPMAVGYLSAMPDVHLGPCRCGMRSAEQLKLCMT